MNVLNSYAVIRASDAGVHAGTVVFHSGREVTLENSRRLWLWHAKGGISLSEVAQFGIEKDSKVCVTVPILIILDACEIIPATEEARQSIMEAAIYTP